MSISQEESDLGFYIDKIGNKRFNFNKFAHYISYNYNLICVGEKTYFLYHKGVYIPIAYQRLTSMMYKTLYSYSNIWSASLEENYARALERVSYYSGKMNNYKHLINLKNCMFNINTFTAIEHDERYYSTIQLAAAYDENADCKEFLKFMDSVFAGDKELISVVQEMIGYCLTSDTQAQCFFILYGSGANGKSVLCNIIKRLVGKNNYSAIPISDLGHSFSRAELQNKVLNISAENEAPNGKPYNSQYIKSISSGDEIKAEFKGKDVFSFSPFCKLLFAVNTLPNFNDKTYGFLRRIKIIPFKQCFSVSDGTADIHLEEKLTEELSGIFNWAVEGLKRLRNNDYKFSPCKAMDEELKKYNELINPYVAFWDECIIYTPNNEEEKVSKKNFYDGYRLWCIRNNHLNAAKVTARKFWIDINEVLVQKKLTAFKFKKTDGGTRFVLGVKFIDTSLLPQCVIRPKMPEKEEELIDVDEIDYLSEL